MSGDRAWVTLATNDSYALGALVVARSLKRVNTVGKLVALITPGVTGPMRSALSSEFDLLEQVNVLDSQDSANLALLTRPELGITFTKLHCWRLTQFSKCVFLDADTLVLQNCDELFDRQEFSAAPDVGWPDCFNSGVFVFTPSLDTYNRLLAFAVSSGSFDGGDQGLLNLYFNDWSVADISRHLPFIYNMVASATYSYLPAFKVFGANVKIVHFIGPEKPWLMYFDTSTGTVRAPMGQQHLYELLQSWWDIFRADVHNKLSPDMGGECEQSATVAEQVQDFFSYISISEPNTASSSEASFSSLPQAQYQPQPPSTHPPQPQPQPEFHWVSVAIQRHNPQYFTVPDHDPDPPDVVQVSQHSSSPSPPSSTHQTATHHEVPPKVEEYSNPEIPCVQTPENKSEPQSEQIPPDESISGSSGLAGAFAKMSLEGSKSQQQIEFEEQMRKHAWESGHIDYMGADSFDNIMKKIQASMAQGGPAPVPQPSPSEPPKRKSKSPSPPKVETVVLEQAQPPKPEVQTPLIPEAKQDPLKPETAPPTAESVKIETTTPSAEPPKIESAPPTVESAKIEAAPPQTAEPLKVVATTEEQEDARLAEERLALEKKLAEQKRVAEQKLEEVKKAAEERATATSAVSATLEQVTPEETATSASQEAPVAPPRRQSKEDKRREDGSFWESFGIRRLGLGLSCLAVVIYAIYYTAST